MDDSSEILSLKAILQTALSKVEAWEKKLTKKPSKRALNKKEAIDREIVRQRKRIDRNIRKKQSL